MKEPEMTSNGAEETSATIGPQPGVGSEGGQRPIWLRLWRDQVVYTLFFLAMSLAATIFLWQVGGPFADGPKIGRIASWAVAACGPISILIWLFLLRNLFAWRRKAESHTKASSQ